MGNQTFYYRRDLTPAFLAQLNKLVDGRINQSTIINESTLSINVDDMDKDTLDQMLTLQGFKPIDSSDSWLLTGITPVTTDAYIVQADDRFIGVNNNSDPVITLPTSELYNGRDIIVKDIGGTISGLNILTIDTEGTAQIDGDNTVTGILAYVSFRLRSDGSNWFTY